MQIPTPKSQPSGITLGPDGALWFVERLGNRVGRISEYPLFTVFLPLVEY